MLSTFQLCCCYYYHRDERQTFIMKVYASCIKLKHIFIIIVLIILHFTHFSIFFFPQTNKGSEDDLCLKTYRFGHRIKNAYCSFIQ